ncbi:MAG TPA: hypothetical protein VM261_34360 [Kofleriaceae bacterium]|nr:hypothetical protein [Kofleriaceae bacterium]
MRAAVIAVAALAACRPPPTSPPSIENRSVEVRTSAAIEYPNGPITDESVARFLSWRFARQLDERTFEASYNDTQDDVIDELHTMGIRTIHELAVIIPEDFEVRGAGEFITEDPANIPGLVRDFMMIHDADRYFEHAWKNRWQSILPANVSALRGYVHDFTPFYDAGVLTQQEVDEAPAPESYRARATSPRPPPQPPIH